MRRHCVHIARCVLLTVIVVCIHWQHDRFRLEAEARSLQPPPLASVRRFLPQAGSLKVHRTIPRAWSVRTEDSGGELGFALQTAPDSNDISGFSGPTNVLIVFKADGTLTGLEILSSEDTRDHVELIRRDPRFLKSLNGLTRDGIARAEMDAVSGATLTSLAIANSIRRRLGGFVVPGKFRQPIPLDAVRKLFPQAHRLISAGPQSAQVQDATGRLLGKVVSSSPIADNEIGYQGPNLVLLGLSPDNLVTGLTIADSYDNQPYVGYVRDDYGFPDLFRGRSLEELAALDLEEAGVEGVAGATMTSQSVARALVMAAAESLREPSSSPRQPDPLLSPRDWGTLLITLAGLAIGLTHLRGHHGLRLSFQLLLIGYLGLINGDMLSQALLVGWAKHGVPWQTSAGLVLLTVAAFLLPVFSGRNVYCSHLCPHGAAQQLIRNRLPWKLKLSRRVRRALSVVPGALLVVVVLVAMTTVPLSLVDIEPFDAWMFRAAGTATICIAVGGMAISAVVPMAYCRFGCPTGALLQYIRAHARSGRLVPADFLAFVCLLLAVTLFLSR